MTFSRLSSLPRLRTVPAQTSSVTAAGKYDRRIIMAKAIAHAYRNKSSGRAWRELMRDALRLAWNRAREDMRVHALVEADRARRLAAAPIPAPATVRPVARRWSRPLAISGARAFSHSW